MNWQVYIILCSDDSLYTGITTDMERRFLQHKQGKGAKFFRGRQPLCVVYLEGGHSRSSAASREARIKAMSRPDKLGLVSGTEDAKGLGVCSTSSAQSAPVFTSMALSRVVSPTVR